MDLSEQVITQNLAALSMALIFIWYLVRRDRGDKETFDAFNKTIQNHLKHALKTENKIASSLQKLTDCIKNLNGKK